MQGKQSGSRGKQYMVWLRLLVKRFWRQPVCLTLLALIPATGIALGIVQQGGADNMGGVAAAVCTGHSAWGEQIEQDLRSQDRESVLDFIFCADSDEVRRRVLQGGADCGFVIEDDIADRVLSGNWDDCIVVYETEGSSITGMVKERIAEAVFRLYSEQSYNDYMSQFSSEAADFAMKAYERRLTDGSTFGFRYISGDADDDTDSKADIHRTMMPEGTVGADSHYGYDTNVVNDGYVFPLKGVLAVIIFISGMCGMLEYDMDDREKRFVRLVSNRITYIVNIWIPVFFVSAAALLCMWASDTVQYIVSRRSVDGQTVRIWEALAVWDAVSWSAQAGRLLLYQLIVVLYCCVLKILLRNREAVLSAIPLMALGSLVCAPVFIRLGAYLPVFAVLEKLFPVTYYLRM